MPDASSDADDRSLTQHLDALYPLARVLAGKSRASQLVTEAYRRAANTPPEARPDDPLPWLYGLLLDARSDGRSTAPGAPSADAAPSAPQASGDSFRRDVAQSVAERTLPVAFAACSARERLILTLDAARDLSDEDLAELLGIDPEAADDVRHETRSALRATLRDTLSGPERMLVDVGLPEDALMDVLRQMLIQRFRPAPSALRSAVSGTLRQARADRAPEAAPSSTKRGPTPWTLRRILTTGALAAVAVLGLILALNVLEPSPEPDPSLAAFSARQASGVVPLFTTSTPDSAAAYVRRAWSRSVSPPRFDGAALTGVGRVEAGDGIEVPVFLYADSTAGGRIVLYAYNYALIDRLSTRTQFDAGIRDQITDPSARILRATNTHSLLIWRARDDVFFAVADGISPEALAKRLGNSAARDEEDVSR